MASGGIQVGRGYVSIRPEFEGDWSRGISVEASKAGSAFAGAFSKALTKALAVPLGAVGASVGAAMAASFASAGAAAGAFKAAVQPQLKSVTEAADAYTKVQEKQAEAEQKTAAASKLAAKGGKEYEQALAAAESASKSAKDAQDAYKLSMSEMPAATRTTAKAFIDLKSETTAWSDSLAPKTMPVFTQGINILRGVIPKLTPLVESAAGAFKGFLDNVGDERSKAVFGSFATNVKDMAGSSLSGFLTAVKNIAVGFTGILNAFAPMSKGMTSGLVGLTDRFAEFGASLRESSGFQQFMTYVRENGPTVFSLIGSVAATVGKLVVALAPLGGATLILVDAFASLVAMIPTPFLTGLVTVIAAATLGFKVYVATVWLVQKATAAWAAIQAVLNGTLALNPIGIVIGALVALGAAIFIAYKKSETFRNIVQAAWEGIQAAAMWAWNNVLKPALSGLVTAFQAVASAASWLWSNVLGPVFGFIAAAAKILFTAVVVIALLPIIAVFKLVAAAASWLWSTVLKPVFDKVAAIFKLVGAGALWLWENIFRPVLGWIGDKASWLWTKAIKPAWDGIKLAMQVVGLAISKLWKDYAQPILGWIGDKGKWLWERALKPAFDRIKTAIGLVGDSFGKAKDAIKTAWDKIQDIARKPVRWIIENVYNAGIVPVWNKVAGAFGAPKIDKMNIKGWATGGILPGYTPGRDVHLAALSGGEAVMRPEWTRAVGPGYVHAMNAAARSGGVAGVQQALGLPGFADGGIFGWVGSAASKTLDLAKSGVSWLKDGLKASAMAGMNKIVRPLIDAIAGSASRYRDMISGVPQRMLRVIFDYSGKADSKLQAAGIGGKGYRAGLGWARRQAGKPYLWGGVGPEGFDCSGFLGAIENVIRGLKPNSRRWATGAFSGRTAPAGWVLNHRSPFMIGITNAGVGHTAGTINGTNVESRGGDGVVIGSRARGANSMMFTDVYGFKYDSGGWLQPGATAAYNATGQPEAVLTASQWRTVGQAVDSGSLEGMSVHVFVGNEELSHIARTEVRKANGELVSVLRAGRKG